MVVWTAAQLYFMKTDDVVGISLSSRAIDWLNGEGYSSIASFTELKDETIDTLTLTAKKDQTIPDPLNAG